jgi:enoyl-CoA hydratase/carnithine racemase
MSKAKFESLSLSTLKVEVELTRSGSIIYITLDRPAAFNAVSMEMLHEMHTLLDMLQHPNTLHEAVAEDHPRVVILKAAGRAFSGGVDIKAADRGIGGKSWDYKNMRSQQLLARMIEKFRAIPQPIIACIQGAAAGAGLAMAIAADLRVATPSASFSAAFVRLGLTGTDMGTSFFLPRLAGLGIASEAILTGRAITAERAYQVGLVNELAQDSQELESKARVIAMEMLACSPVGLQVSKEQLNSVAEGGSLRAAIVAENSHQMLLVNDPVTAKIAQAWVEKMVAGKKRASSSSGVTTKSKL